MDELTRTILNALRVLNPQGQELGATPAAPAVPPLRAAEELPATEVAPSKPPRA